MVVESSTNKMMRIIVLVYLIPVVLFLTGYVSMVFLMPDRVGIQYTVAILGFLIGVIGAVGYDRRLKKQGGLIFRIVRLF